ncbi:hypothetical protein [Burkholderia cepacia]|uniref:hypothetical protein n=1 Tax=Burkholderia cepacia TaxID=292 RepID=UPI00075A26CC|nr:hypothetical protein [Burkholderia cepacia]KVH29587.1 hypothetical protein WS88_34600 [Burkholderia cepacia]
MPDELLNTDTAAENQSQGIVGEIIEGLHKVETAVEHLVHGDGAPSNSDPTPQPSAEQLAAIAMGTNTQAPQEAGGAVTGESNNASGDSKPEESAGALTGTDDPNAGASPAASTSASDTASSASPASSGADIEDVQKSDALSLLESLPAEALHAVHAIISEIESDLTEVSIGIGLAKLETLKGAIDAKL